MKIDDSESPIMAAKPQKVACAAPKESLLMPNESTSTKASGESATTHISGLV